MEHPASAREQFGRNAEKYRDEPLFAEGEDLQRMRLSITLSGEERMLDVGTGAGHVALAFAPHVRECVGIDVSERMVRIAEELTRTRGIANVRYEVATAERLPFETASFDVVTYRFTAHHFLDLQAAVEEAARVLRPGGTLLVADHYAPEEPVLDRFVNDLDRMRDPSHVRASSLSEWKALLEEQGLQWRLVSSWDLRLEVGAWLDRAETPPSMRGRVLGHLGRATPECVEAFHIELDDEGAPRSFAQKVALMHGTKQPSSVGQSTSV